MAADLLTTIENILKIYAAEVKAKFDLPIDFNPEDQLKSPITTLFKSAGTALNLKVEAVTEVHAAELGRPDVGVAVKNLLAGHVAAARRAHPHTRSSWILQSQLTWPLESGSGRPFS